MKVNPFQPNRPVHPGMFVGRLREVGRIEDHLLQTKAGNPGAFMVTGERGIGKSSLLLYARVFATGVGAEDLNFLVIHTDLDKTTTQLGLVRKIEMGLRRAVESSDPAAGFMRRAWEFLQRLEAGGFGLKSEGRLDPETLIEESAYSLASSINSLTSAERVVADWGFGRVYDGVLLLIDEADNAAPGVALGSFLKLLIERVQRSACDRLCVGLAGLPRLTDVLVKSHESSLRLFEELPLDRLSPEDIGNVIDAGLREANSKNPSRTEMDGRARSALVYLSEGFPHFIQQFAFCAFAKDDDGIISIDDVFDSAFGSGGAFDLIGQRYYREAFYKKIREESYRQVLRIMATEKGEWVTKEAIRRKFKGKASTLSNAIHALVNGGMIVRKSGTVGTYRLVHRGFATWIKYFTLDEVTLRQLASEPATANGNADTKTGP